MRTRIVQWLSFVLVVLAAGCSIPIESAESLPPDGWLVVQYLGDDRLPKCWRIAGNGVNWERGSKAWWRQPDDRIVFVSGTLVGVQVREGKWHDAEIQAGVTGRTVCQ